MAKLTDSDKEVILDFIKDRDEPYDMMQGQGQERLPVGDVCQQCNMSVKVCRAWF